MGVRGWLWRGHGWHLDPWNCVPTGHDQSQQDSSDQQQTGHMTAEFYFLHYLDTPQDSVGGSVLDTEVGGTNSQICHHG